jgi:hypothetical protein
MAKLKFQRTKPHASVGTLGGMATPVTGPTTAGPWQNRTGTETYVHMNHGPMIDHRNREERRAKKKYGPTLGSQYKKRRWWE